jgi:hypothetical protein
MEVVCDARRAVDGAESPRATCLLARAATGSPRHDPVHEWSIPVAHPGVTRARSRIRKRTVGAMSTNKHHGEALGPVIGLVALTVGCLALSAYMGRDLTGGAAIALSVDAVICRVGLNSASATGSITHPAAPTTTTDNGGITP